MRRKGLSVFTGRTGSAECLATRPMGVVYPNLLPLVFPKRVPGDLFKVMIKLSGPGATPANSVSFPRVYSSPWHLV